jgi:hypothetical protein
MLTAIRRASSLYETISIKNDNDATTTGLAEIDRP